MTSVETIPIKIVFDRKDASEWQSTNPVIDAGEMVVELDTHKLKVGDGKLNYNDLPYYEGPQGESVTKVQLSENGDLSVWIGDKETKLGNIKGQKGDKGTSITDITKDGETLTIKLSDDTQKTFNIPNGQKGDRGKSVESARVDESGHLRLKIEEEQEKDLGNVKGDKGDSITITDQQRVSEGVQLTFSDETKVVIPKGEKGDTGDAKNIDLSVYATKAELKEIDVSKQLTDYLQKTEADKTYLKKSDKVELPRDLVKTGDIADVVRKPDLTAYATKDELKKISVGQAIPVFTTSYQYDSSYLKYYSDSYRATWSVNEDASKLLAGDIVALEITNTSERAKNYLIVSVVSSSRSSITSISRELSKDKPEGTTFLTQKDADKIYATKQHKHEIDDINGLQSALSHKANAQHSHSEYLEQSTADNLYLAKHELQGYLSAYLRQGDIQYQLNNIGKIKDEETGRYLSVHVVDKGNVPYDTSGMIVFERSGGK